MAVHDGISALEEPFTEDTVLQVRTGRVKNVFGISLQSAIYKTVRKEPLKVSKLGFEGDEHAYHDHGGPEKALLQYCAQHYESWKHELPQSEHLFTTGGFGENLVGSKANERNVCIGDIISIGNEVVAQVTGSRAPCAKLNHRFEVKDMSRRSQTLARTGWFYRILHEGFIEPGDKIKLLERLNPDWTVAQVQHYLYIEKSNADAMRKIVKLEGLGKEIRNIMQKRLDKNETEDQEGRLTGGNEAFAMKKWADYRITSHTMETPQIACLRFSAVEPQDNPTPVLPGSHVRVKLGGKLVRAYSVVTGDNNDFELGIALDANSRGGSRYLHNGTKVGDILQMGRITTSFPLASDADHHVLIAGGIGITAFITAAQYLDSRKESYELHYAVRSATDIAFARLLQGIEHVKIYDHSVADRLDIAKILNRTQANTHIYCCGPQRLMDGVTPAARACDIDDANIHFEAFEVATGGQAFSAELVLSGRTVDVDSEHSLLDILQRAGFDVDSSCEVGNCGTCRVTYCGGQIIHRGTGLVKEEQEREMLACVSRGIGKIAIEL